MARFADPISATRASTQAPAQGVVREGSRTLAGMLLAAAMAALLVVADQVIDTWSDGHLLAGWVALWTVAFAALAFLTTPLRNVTAYLASAFVGYLADMRAARAEIQMWEIASRDPRVVADLRVAKMRQAE